MRLFTFRETRGSGVGDLDERRLGDKRRRVFGVLGGGVAVDALLLEGGGEAVKFAVIFRHFNLKR